MRPSLNFGGHFSTHDTLRPSLNIGRFGEHTCVFILVHSLSLHLKGTTTIARGSIDTTTVTSDTATAYTTTTIGHVHVNDDDGNGQCDDGGDSKRTSGHDDNERR